MDSDPAVLDLTGKALARSIAKMVDERFFGTTGASATAYAGIGSLAGVQVVDTGGLTGFDNLDKIHDLKATLVANNAEPTHIVVAPDVATALAKAKQATNSNLGLFDSVEDGIKLAGLIALVSPHVGAGNAWVFDKSQLVAVRRLGTTLAKSTDIAFAEDSVQLRVTTRISWGAANPAGVGRLYDAP